MISARIVASAMAPVNVEKEMWANTAATDAIPVRMPKAMSATGPVLLLVPARNRQALATVLVRAILSRLAASRS